MACEARVSHVPRYGTVPKLGIGQFSVVSGNTMSYCGTGPWHLGVKFDCGRMLVFVFLWEPNHQYMCVSHMVHREPSLASGHNRAGPNSSIKGPRRSSGA